MDNNQENEAISNFLKAKQSQIDKKKELKEKVLISCGDVITKFSTQGNNTQSDQEKRNKAVAMLFIGSSACVLGQVMGIDIVPDHIANFASSVADINVFDTIEDKVNAFSYAFNENQLKTTVNNIFTDVIGFTSSNLTENSPQFLKDMTGLLLEMNYYLDPNKVDYSKLLNGIAAVGLTTGGMYAADVFNSKPYEERIAKYVEKNLPKEERASFAKNMNKHIQSAGTIESIFSKIPLFKKPALFVANFLNESYQHAISPKQTFQKAWISSHIGINTLKMVFSDQNNRDRINALNKELEDEKYNLNVNIFSNAKEKIKSSDFYTKMRNEGSNDSVSPTAMIKEASNNAYGDILKVNVKNALAKTLFVLGDKNKTKNEKKKALFVLNDISKLHKRTIDNRFDHYQVISDIAEKEIKAFKSNKKHQFKAFNNLSDAMNYINKKQETKFSQSRFKNGKNSSFNKVIVDKLNFKEAFSDIAINAKIREATEIENVKDALEEQKNEKLYKKNKSRIRR